METRSICDGLSVVEAGAGSIAASLAGMLLADFGARVIKVEPPEGDRLRQLHPAGFLVWNRGKESVAADLRTEAGRSDVRRLMSSADVVLEGFGTGVAERWGLGYEHLREDNPGLVYCSIKGFGSSGSYAHIPAYEGIVAAKAGVYSMGAFGFRSGPIFFSAPLGSFGAGNMAVAGILAALIARDRLGVGQRVEATMLQGLNPLDYFGTMHWQHAQRAQEGSAAPTQGTGVSASRYNFFVPTQDGRWVVFTQMLPHQAQALSRAAGIDDTLADPRFATQPYFDTAEHAQEWEDRLWEAMAAKPYQYWEEVFLADPDIAFELARLSEEGLDHQQIRHNGEVVIVDDQVLGPVEQIGPLARFSESPVRIRSSAPWLGANNGHLEPRPAPAATGDSLTSPLSGVTIVELGYFYAMPYGVTMAAGLGARVIKLEGAQGDPMRRSFGAPETGAAKTIEGKESVVLDLQSPEGQRIARQLVAKADVFVNGFRPGVAERMGLGYEALSTLNPRLLYLHAGGYGSDGPMAHRPIYAQVAQAVAGSIGRYGGRWLDPVLTQSLSTFEAQVVVLPRLRGPGDGDSNAALGVLSSLLFGLYDQRRTGRGQFVSTSMIGANAWAYADDFNRYASKPPLETADEDNHGLNALYRLYKTSAGWVFLAAQRQCEWERLVTALDVPHLGEHPRFVTESERSVHDSELTAILAEVFVGRSAQQWEHTLTGRGVACVQAFEGSHSEFTSTDPVLLETGLTAEVEHPLFGKIVRHGPIVEFSGTPARVAPGCLLGQHTRPVLRELGYTQWEIADLEAQGVVISRPAFR